MGWGAPSRSAARGSPGPCAAPAVTHTSPDLVFDQPILVVPDGAALLAEAGHHHASRFHVLYVIGDREVELQLPAPDAEINPSLEREKALFAPKKESCCLHHHPHVLQFWGSPPWVSASPSQRSPGGWGRGTPRAGSRCTSASW